MDPPPLPPSSSSSSSYTSFPILAITILGILATSILLLSYYLFLTRCRLSSSSSSSSSAAAPLRGAPPAEPRGLDPRIISALPVIRSTPPSAAGVRIQECAICLAEPRGDDALRLLPDCSHAFHVDCVDTWLQSSTNCPLCRTNVTSPFEHPSDARGIKNGTTRSPPRGKNKVGASMGDECVDVARAKDERFYVQPVRRSLSMDSSGDRQLILSVRETLNETRFSALDGGGERGEGSSSGAGGGSGRARRPFFSFGSGRSSRSAVLPVDIV